MQTELIYRLAIDFILIVALAVMPVLRGEEAFFGVRVSREFYEGEGRRILRTYRLGLALMLIVNEAIGLALSKILEKEALPHTSLFLIMTVTATVLYIAFYRRIKPFELRGERQRFALSLKPRALEESRSIFFSSALIVILAIPFILLPYFYPGMPETIPVHWDLRGQANGWARKSLSAVLVLPTMSAYLQGMFLLLKHGIVESKMTLPAERSKEYLHYKEESLRITLAMMDWMSLMCAMLLTTLATTMILSGSEYQPFLQAYAFKLVFAVTSSILLYLAYYLYRIRVVNKRMKAATGRVYVQRDTDAARWYGGGLVYYNPEDPAVFVEKRVGFGYTINFGNRRALPYLLYVLGLFGFTAWALAAL